MKFGASFATCLVLFATSALALPSDSERASVQEWDDAAARKGGIDYEIYKPVTEDGWELTLFHLTGRVGFGKPPASEKPPLLFQGGFGMDATYWLE